MKCSKWIKLAAVVAAVWMSVPAFAEDPKPAQPPQRGQNGQRPARGGDPTQMVEQIKGQLEQLNLTDEQKGKVETILKGIQEKAAPLIEKLKDEATREQARTELGTVLREGMTSMQEVLTPEQKEKLATLRQQRGGGQGGQGQGQQGQRGARMGQWVTQLREGAATLNLSDEQKPKVRELLAGAQTKNEELLKEVTGQQGDREKMRESMQKIMTLRTETIAKFTEILNDEQKAAFKKWSEENMPQQGGPGRGGNGQNQPGRRPGANPPL